MGWMDGWVVNSDASKLPQKNLTKAMNHKSRNFFFPIVISISRLFYK